MNSIYSCSSRGFILAFFSLLVGPAIAQDLASTPDFSGVWTVRFETVFSGQEMIDNLPEDVVFIDDTGPGELGEGEYSGLQLSDKALLEIENYNFDDEWSISNTCNPPSVAFYMQAPFPIEIQQGRDIIVFRIEYFDMYRMIYMDGRGHPPEDAPRTKNGHSIGYWDGDELVVDTTHISSATFMNNGFNHSDDLHMVERFKMSDDGQTLWSTEVTDDSAIFEGRAGRYVAWRSVPGEYIYSYDCDPAFGR